MKNLRTSWPLLLLAPTMALLLDGCSKEQTTPILPPAELTMDYPLIPFTIHAGEVAGQFQLDLPLDAEVLGQVLTAHEYGLGQVTDFRFTVAKLHLNTPADGNYDALGAVTVQLASGDGVPVTVASLNPVPTGTHTLALPLAQVNVADLLKNGSAHLIATVQLDGSLPAVSTHKLALSAKVTVQH